MRTTIRLDSGGEIEIRSDPKHLSISLRDTTLEFATIYPAIKEDCDFAVSLRRGQKQKWLDTKVD